jgi:hypothetical protein
MKKPGRRLPVSWPAVLVETSFPPPPCIPSGTRQFNELRAVPLATRLFPDTQAVTANHFVCTAPSVLSSILPPGSPIGPPVFHPTPPWSAGSHRFLPSPWYSTFPSTPGTSIGLAIPAPFVPPRHGTSPFTVQRPPPTTCTSAIPYGIGSCPAGRFVSRHSRYMQDLPR